ncbi:MAG: hypothetical protein DME18_10230 [Verrucomicrobia bacterium]|nr:MAG: hypothetical protein DME18_10230 [Verrucomicrobiota bacterium]
MIKSILTFDLPASKRSTTRYWFTIFRDEPAFFLKKVSYGIRVACCCRMLIQVVNPTTGRRAKVEARILSKVLHLACFQGWQPERLDAPPPLGSWETEIVMPYVTPYMSGTVSDTDAAGLLAGLRRVQASEADGLESEVYMVVLGLIAIAEGGRFELQPEDASAGEGPSPWASPGAVEDPTLPFADRPAIKLDPQSRLV